MDFSELFQVRYILLRIIIRIAHSLTVFLCLFWLDVSIRTAFVVGFCAGLVFMLWTGTHRVSTWSKDRIPKGIAWLAGCFPALLLWVNSPILCMRTLTFLAVAYLAIHLLELSIGDYITVSHDWPDRAKPPTDRKITLGWVGLSIAVILLNEAVIAIDSQANVLGLVFWLTWSASSSAQTLARWAVVWRMFRNEIEDTGVL